MIVVTCGCGQSYQAQAGSPPVTCQTCGAMIPVPATAAPFQPTPPTIDPFAMPSQTPLSVGQAPQPSPYAETFAPPPKPTSKSNTKTVVVLAAIGGVVLLGFIGIISAAFYAAQQRLADNWQVYRSTNGRFEVELPGKPKRKQKQAPPPANDITIHFATVDKGRRRGAYFVVYSDYPPRIGGSPKDIMKGMSKGQLRSMQPVIKNDRKPITWQGNPGLEIDAIGVARARGKSMQAAIRMRIIMVGRRAYQIFWIGPKDNVPEQKIQRVFDSFKLTL